MKNNSLIKIFTDCKIIKLSFLCIIMALPACDFLDLVPENTATIDHAFKSRVEARKFMYGCFSFLPDVGRQSEDPAMHGSDEIYTNTAVDGDHNRLRRILLGEQGTVAPWANYWASRSGSMDRVPKALWTGISDCNIFLANIDKPFDLPGWERRIWTGQVLFAKAYMQFWLLRQYGPIPLMKENLPMGADSEQVAVYREPVDDVVNYIVELLDEACELLPEYVLNELEYMGLPTKAIAKALKAQVLTLAASPLFNCNEDFKDYKDNRGRQLFPQDNSKEREKWEKAAKALIEAIEEAHAVGHRLYDARTDFINAPTLSEQTLLSFQVRGAVTEPWNTEIIWGSSRGSDIAALQRMCSPIFAADQANGSGWKFNGVPLHIVKQFYTKNGIPIEDDVEWTGRDITELRTPTTEPEEFYYFQPAGTTGGAYQTISLHFDREPRFYGSITFDGGTYFGNTRILNDAPIDGLWREHIRFTMKGQNAWTAPNRSNPIGTVCKKLINCRCTSGNQNFTAMNYSFPIIRLADLYLLYAEALNEIDASAGEVFEYIDRVRERSGLKGVDESWNSAYATAESKTKLLSKEGRRKIIQRERMIELAFEGPRFWDLRRWKLAEEYLNGLEIRGWNVFAEELPDFYRVNQDGSIGVLQHTVKFEKKDYFSPIKGETLTFNANLLQSPGWNEK